MEISIQGDLLVGDESWSKNLLRRMHQLRLNLVLCDTTIVTDDGRSFPAHSNILAACSPVLQSSFPSDGNQDFLVPLHGVSSATMSLLLDFIYTGKIECDGESLLELLLYAEQLDIRGVSEAVTKQQQEAESTNRNPPLKVVESGVQVTHNGNCITMMGPDDAAFAIHLELETCQDDSHSNQDMVPASDFVTQSVTDPTLQKNGESVPEMEEGFLVCAPVPEADIKQEATENDGDISKDAVRIIPPVRRSARSIKKSKLMVEYEKDKHRRTEVKNVQHGSAKREMQTSSVEMEQPMENVAEDMSEMVVSPAPVKQCKKKSRKTSAEQLEDVGSTQQVIVAASSSEKSMTTRGGTKLSREWTHYRKDKSEDKTLQIAGAEQEMNIIDEDVGDSPTSQFTIIAPDKKAISEDKLADVSVENAHDLLDLKASVQDMQKVDSRKRPRVKLAPIPTKKPHVAAEKRKSLGRPRTSKVDSGEEAWICKTCGKVLQSFGSLKVHEMRHLEVKPFQCEYCEKNFATKSSLDIHRRTHTGEKPYQCDQCGKSFGDPSAMRAHVFKHTPANNWKCSECHEEFEHKRDLVKHAKARHGKVDKPIKCSICGKGFIKDFERRIHERIHEMGYSCQYCNKIFARKKIFEIHERTHTGEKPFKCQYCGAGYASQESLRNHEKKHTSGKEFSCAHCPKRFFRAWERDMHQRIHTGERPYVCQYCQSAFKCISHLRVHERGHTGDRPYKCTRCLHRFTSSSSLKRHQATHTASQQLYYCVWCSKIFPRMSQLKSHVKSQHRDAVDTATLSIKEPREDCIKEEYVEVITQHEAQREQELIIWPEDGVVYQVEGDIIPEGNVIQEGDIVQGVEGVEEVEDMQDMKVEGITVGTIPDSVSPVYVQVLAGSVP